VVLLAAAGEQMLQKSKREAKLVKDVFFLQKEKLVKERME
jgi:hypothetical protein